MNTRTGSGSLLCDIQLWFLCGVMFSSFPKTQGRSRLYAVPSVALSFSRTPSTPRSAQGVLASADDMTGFLPMYDRCINTGMLDSTRPVSSKAERVTSGKLLCSIEKKRTMFVVIDVGWYPLVVLRGFGCGVFVVRRNRCGLACGPSKHVALALPLKWAPKDLEHPEFGRGHVQILSEVSFTLCRDIDLKEPN